MRKHPTFPAFQRRGPAALEHQDVRLRLMVGSAGLTARKSFPPFMPMPVCQRRQLTPIRPSMRSAEFHHRGEVQIGAIRARKSSRGPDAGAGKRRGSLDVRAGPARAMLFGGAPLDGPRHLWWNFVSSSKNASTRQAGMERRQIRLIHGDDQEFIPCPRKKNENAMIFLLGDWCWLSARSLRFRAPAWFIGRRKAS